LWIFAKEAYRQHDDLVHLDNITKDGAYESEKTARTFAFFEKRVSFDLRDAGEPSQTHRELLLVYYIEFL